MSDDSSIKEDNPNTEVWSRQSNVSKATSSSKQRGSVIEDNVADNMSDDGASDNDDTSKVNSGSIEHTDKGNYSGSPNKKKRKRKHKKNNGGLNKMALAKLNNAEGVTPLSDMAF